MSEHAKDMFPSKDGTFNKVKTRHNIFSLMFLQDFLNETLNNKKKKKREKCRKFQCQERVYYILRKCCIHGTSQITV